MLLTCTNCGHQFIRDDKRKLGSTRLCYICNADKRDRVPESVHCYERFGKSVQGVDF